MNAFAYEDQDVCSIKPDETHEHTILYRKHILKTPISGWRYFISSLDPSKKLTPGKFMFAYVGDVADNFGKKIDGVVASPSYENSTISMKVQL